MVEPDQFYEYKKKFGDASDAAWEEVIEQRERVFNKRFGGRKK